MEDDKLLGCFGVLAWGALLIPITTLLNGWVLSVMWGWFIVPIFDVQALTWAMAMGISCVVSLFLSDLKREDHNAKDKGITERIINATLFALLRPFFALGFGWAILQFV